MLFGESLNSTRFETHRRIGAGTFGIVYEAFDPVRDEVVAVKVLREAFPDALYRFKREFRSLSDITDRNLVRLYELFSEGDQWMVSMELIRGHNFIEYVRGDSAAPAEDGALRSHRPVVDHERLTAALSQLASGVNALHNAGKLHRDIKPSNVLVGEDHRVVLLDFGLVMDTDVRGLQESTSTSGSPLYMSPEQGAGEPLGHASDWYSVGVVLYEALTGGVPFRGTYLEVMNSKRAGDVAPPSSIVPNVPEHLDALCRDLLRRDPDARPNADEIMRRLAGSAEPVLKRKAPASPFVGRDRHLEVLQMAFETSVSGVQTTICIQGVSGAGKTALIRTFVERLNNRVPDLLVLTGRCYQRESLPYKGVDSLVDAMHRYLSRLEPSELDALLPRDIAAAEQLFPMLRDLGDMVRMRRRVTPSLVPDQQELRRRAFAAMRELFLRVAERTKLVIVIDDFQWGDVDSAELLEDILRPPDAPPLLFILGFRSDDASLRPFVTAFGNRVDAININLDPLSREESRQLAEQAIDGDDTDALELAQIIANASDGSPFLILELARTFSTASDTTMAAIRHSASFLNARDATIRQVLLSRLRRLEPEAARLLKLIAVNGRPILVSPLRRAFDAVKFDDNLDLLEREHLVRKRETAEGHSVEPYHDRIAEAATSMLDSSALKRMHADLAVALEAFESSDAELLADHFLAAGLDARAVFYVETAAATAGAALAFDRAARLYRSALALTPSNANTLRRRLGDILANSGRGAEAASEFLAVQPHDRADELELRKNAAQQLLVSGHVDEGLAVVRSILSSVDIPYPETRRDTIVALLAARTKLALHGLRFRERPLSEITPEELLRVDTCRAVALGLSSVDTIRGAVFQTRYLLYAMEAGDPQRIAHALTMECGYSAVPGSRAIRRTRKLTAKMHELAERLATPYARAFADEAEGVVASLQGRWTEGAERLESAERAFLEHCTGVTWELNTARLFGMRCRQFRGDMKLMAARFPSLLRDAEDRGDRYFATSIVLFSHYVYLIEDDPATASENVEKAIREWSHAGFHVQHMWHLRAAVEIALYEGRGTLAWTKLSTSWRAVSTSLVSRIQFTRMVLEDVRGRAALAAAKEATGENDRQRLINMALHAAKRLEDERAEWGRPLALLIRAGAAFVNGRQEEGDQKLRQAEALFESLEMHLHAAAVRVRLWNPAGSEWMIAQGIKNPPAMSRLLVP